MPGPVCYKASRSSQQEIHHTDRMPDRRRQKNTRFRRHCRKLGHVVCAQQTVNSAERPRKHDEPRGSEVFSDGTRRPEYALAYSRSNADRQAETDPENAKQFAVLSRFFCFQRVSRYVHRRILSTLPKLNFRNWEGWYVEILTATVNCFVYNCKHLRT